MGPEVHFGKTMAWAAEEGFSREDAERIAAADIAFDANYPARRSLANITRHFAPWAWVWSAYYLRQAAERSDLRLLGYALHCAQDAVAHGRFGEKHLLQRAGWGQDPDVWGNAGGEIRRRTERATRKRLRTYLSASASR